MQIFKPHQNVICPKVKNQISISLGDHNSRYFLSDKKGVRYTYCPYSTHIDVDLDKTKVYKILTHPDIKCSANQYTLFVLEGLTWTSIKTSVDLKQIILDLNEKYDNGFFLYGATSLSEITQYYFLGSVFYIFDKGESIDEMYKVYDRIFCALDFETNALTPKIYLQDPILKDGEVWLTMPHEVEPNRTSFEDISDGENCYILNNSVESIMNLAELLCVNVNIIEEKEYNEATAKTDGLQSLILDDKPTLVALKMENDTLKIVS